MPGCTCSTTTSGLAVNYKLPLAVLAGFLQLIPEVGPIVNIVGVTLLALLTRGKLPALEVLGLYVGIQWLTGKLIADRFEPMSDVHPAVLVLVIVALTQLGPVVVLPRRADRRRGPRRLALHFRTPEGARHARRSSAVSSARRTNGS